MLNATKGVARRQVQGLDSLWSVHLSQMSSFIIAELYHITPIYEIYNKSLNKGKHKVAGSEVSFW